GYARSLAYVVAKWHSARLASVSLLYSWAASASLWSLASDMNFPKRSSVARTAVPASKLLAMNRRTMSSRTVGFKNLMLGPYLLTLIDHVGSSNHPPAQAKAVAATYHHGVFRRLASCARWVRSSSASAPFSMSSLITMPLSFKHFLSWKMHSW